LIEGGIQKGSNCPIERRWAKALGGIAVGETSRLVLRGLYAITPDDSDTPRLVRKVEAVLAAKPALLQFRNKLASPKLKEAQALALAALCRKAGVPLIINDDPGLALRVGADGVHLGAEDDGLVFARALLGPGAIIGVSCYGNLKLAQKAAGDGANYVAFGSVFASSTKPNAVRVELGLLAQARHTLHVPLCAIGGIERGNAGQLIALGVDLVAVISDVFDDPQPGLAATQFGKLFQRDC